MGAVQDGSAVAERKPYQFVTGFDMRHPSFAAKLHDTITQQNTAWKSACFAGAVSLPATPG